MLSGGGSGHEPMHGGFVGRGMLDAACPGEVFTSPTPDQMYEATKAVDGGAGVLHIVKNYTGDILNFEMAADLAKGEGIEVEAVVTDDDVAVQDSLYTAGRRGVGITVLAREDRRGGRRGGQGPRHRARALPPGERRGPQHGHGAHLLHGAGGGQAHVRAGRRRDGDRHRHPRRARSRAHEARVRRATSCGRLAGPVMRRPARSPPATGCWPSSTAWAGRPCWSSTSSTTSCATLLAERGVEVARSLSARTSPRSRWPAARSRCCASTTR